MSTLLISDLVAGKFYAALAEDGFYVFEAKDDDNTEVLTIRNHSYFGYENVNSSRNSEIIGYRKATAQEIKQLLESIDQDYLADIDEVTDSYSIF